MWLLNEDNELINLDVFVALRLEPVPDSENMYCLVGVLGGEGDSGETDEAADEEEDSDESFVQLSPPLPKSAADRLFGEVVGKLAPVQVKAFLPSVTPQPKFRRPAPPGRREGDFNPRRNRNTGG